METFYPETEVIHTGGAIRVKGRGIVLVEKKIRAWGKTRMKKSGVPKKELR